MNDFKRLSRNVKPTKYELTLHPNLTKFEFNGKVVIHVVVCVNFILSFFFYLLTSFRQFFKIDFSLNIGKIPWTLLFLKLKVGSLLRKSYLWGSCTIVFKKVQQLVLASLKKHQKLNYLVSCSSAVRYIFSWNFEVTCSFILLKRVNIGKTSSKNFKKYRFGSESDT